MLNLIKNRKLKKAFRDLGGKLANGQCAFSKRTIATFEEGVSLGRIYTESPRLSIGAHTYIRSGTTLSVVSSIGRFCSIGSECVIGQEKYTHPTNWISTHPFQYEESLEYHPELSFTSIGHDVWLGHGATILEGVQVGTGAVIATRSLVTRDVPPYAIVGGNPAKIIRYRHSKEIIERLMASKWWDLDINFLKSLPLNDPTTFLDKIETTPSLPKATYRSIKISKKALTKSS